MATIRKRGSKFQAQVRRQGFPPVTKSFSKLADARAWSCLIEAQAERGELPPNRQALSRITLGELVIRYRDTVLPNNKSGHVETIMLNAFLRHRICRRSLAELTVADFAAWKDERLAPNGKPITPKSVKRLLSPIQHMFELAITEWKLPLRENPLAKLRLAVADNKRERRLRTGEVESLIASLGRCQNPYIKPITLFALETGMRRGEILAMKWDHVDLQRRSVVIPEAKNGHSRTIPLTSKAIALLGGLTRNGTTVFPLTPNALRLSWSRTTARAGIADLHFHDLRHEAISRFFELGLTVPEVASISGHRDIRMLLRYAHADQSRVTAKLDAGSISCPSDSQLSMMLTTPDG